MIMRIVPVLAMAAFAALAACGPMAQNSVGANVVQGVANRVTGSNDSQAAGDVTAPVELTRAVIEQQDADLLRVSLISREVTTFVTLAGRNSTKTTWFSADGLSVTFDRGLLVATRGIGDDLMGADVAAVQRSFNGGGNHLRTLEFLSGLDQIERIVFECSMAVTGRETITIFERSYMTTVFEENCASGNTTFKNTYWRDLNGVIWQARQWISPLVGYLGYQRL